ncbi:33095_t:CDS:2, partial [Racocetra persica]
YDRTEYSLKIQTLEDYPSMYDLPISLPFDIFTASVQDPSTPEGDNAAFCLKRESYNSVTASQVTMSILCKYDPKGHNANVADTTKCQPIISIASELVSLKRSSTPNKKQPRNVTKNINEDLQEESFLKAKRLKSAINQVNEIK